MTTTTLIPLFMPALDAVRRAAEQALRALLGAARHHAGDWRRRREARANHLSLCALDDRVLRDLGIDRSELRSIALHPSDPDRLRIGA
jgi:uncharacterized protein YjiS (DUF1127 family)